MSFLKKLGQVAADTANVIQKKSTELKTVYEKEKFSGLMSVAEKNLESLSVATSDYLDNLKKVNETVIHETAKNANSSFEAIWRSTLAVSKETLTFVSRDLKNQALKLYKAWEDVEVEKVMTPEMKMLYDATKIVTPSTLMTFCGATKEGPVYSINNLQVEIYGEIWISPAAPEKKNVGSMSLLQHIIVNSTQENMSDELLLRQCLSMMYKITMVRQEYDRVYAEYLAANPEITPLASPFDEREVEATTTTEEAEGTESAATAKVVESVKVGAKQALEKGIKGVEVLSQKVKDVSTQATKDIKDAWTPKEKVSETVEQAESAVTQEQASVVNAKEQALEEEVRNLRQQLAEANAKAVAPAVESVDIKKPAPKRVTKKPTATEEKKAKSDASVTKPATKRAAPKKPAVTTDEKPVVKKPTRKKSETQDKN